MRERDATGADERRGEEEEEEEERMGGTKGFAVLVRHVNVRGATRI